MKPTDRNEISVSNGKTFNEVEEKNVMTLTLMNCSILTVNFYKSSRY